MKFAPFSLLLMLCGLLALPLAGQAHPASASAISLRSDARNVILDVQLPLDQLAIAAPQLSVTDGSPLVGETLRMTADYLARHIHVSSGADQAYALSIDQMSTAQRDGEPYLLARLTFEAPAATSTYVYKLQADPVVHKVRSHRIYLRKLTDSGALEALDVLHFQHDSLLMTQVPPAWGKDFGQLLLAGAKHISSGADHLLFLLCLLISAPLYIRAGRWQARTRVLGAWRKSIVLVSAFTLGHCTTLALSVLTPLQADSRTVEILVAMTVLVAAVNLLLPLLIFDTLLMAAGFGLIHGLAFASALQGFDFDWQSRVLALAGFNLGIELVQLVLLLALLPGLIVLRRYPFYRALRVCAGWLIGGVALYWLVQRAIAWPAPAALDEMLPTPELRVGLLMLVALAGLGFYGLWREWRAGQLTQGQ